MLKSGLVSVSFRALGCEEIIGLASKAGLGYIEWGGDVHVPPENIENAKRVGDMTRERGLMVSSYGSYYRLGSCPGGFTDVFGRTLNAAKALGAPVIRVWAGTKGSAEISPEERQKLVEEAKAIADMAKRENISLAFECHGDTLTDCRLSTLRLMEETGRDNLNMYWQPNNLYPFSENLRTLRELLPYLLHVHVFNWPSPGVRKPLREAREEWERYLSLAASAEGEHICMLEFMPDDSPSSLESEAAALNSWLERICPSL